MTANTVGAGGGDDGTGGLSGGGVDNAGSEGNASAASAAAARVRGPAGGRVAVAGGGASTAGDGCASRGGGGGRREFSAAGAARACSVQLLTSSCTRIRHPVELRQYVPCTGLSNFRVTSSPRHSVADAAGAQQYSVPRLFAVTPLVRAGEDVNTCAAASVQTELQTFPGGSQCDVTNPKVADALHGKRDESGATSPMIDWRFVEV